MIKTMISENQIKPGMQIDTVVVDGHTIHLITEYVGKVLSTFERNGRDDSDFIAVVWDEAKQEPRQIEYASTRGWSYCNSATVDATPETKAAYEAWKDQQRKLDEARRAAYEAAKPTKGKTVKVVAGRKLPLGAVGEVFWFGEAREFGQFPRGGYKARGRELGQYAKSMAFGDPRDGMRVGLMLDGKKVFTAATNVEVVS